MDSPGSEFGNQLQVKLGPESVFVRQVPPPSDCAADHLGIAAGSPVLYVERDYLRRKELVLRTLDYYRSDLFSNELILKLKRR